MIDYGDTEDMLRTLEKCLNTYSIAHIKRHAVLPEPLDVTLVLGAASARVKIAWINVAGVPEDDDSPPARLLGAHLPA